MGNSEVSSAVRYTLTYSLLTKPLPQRASTANPAFTAIHVYSMLLAFRVKLAP